MANIHGKKIHATLLPTLVTTTVITFLTGHCFAGEWRVGGYLGLTYSF